MNKKEVNKLKKEFNMDTYKLKIKEIYTVYLKKDNNAIIHAEAKYFDLLDVECQELYIENFKKLLSGSLDTKLFELAFKVEEDGNIRQQSLFKALNSPDLPSLQEEINLFINKVMENYNYDMDIVLSFIRAEYMLASSKRSEEYEIGEDDDSARFQFVMGSVNKVEASKKALMYDSETQELRANSTLDVTINLKAPLEGFMFPTLDNGYSDVNKVLYYTSKEKNSVFIEEVLNCDAKLTAEEEKECFSAILSNVTGGKITPARIQDIYEEMQERAIELQDEEEIALGAKDIKGILESKNIEMVQDVEAAYEEIMATKEHMFKVENILPKFNSKSVKIVNQDTNITISPKNLSNIKQVRDKQGNKCLLIQLTEDVLIDGLRVEVEEEI